MKNSDALIDVIEDTTMIESTWKASVLYGDEQGKGQKPIFVEVLSLSSLFENLRNKKFRSTDICHEHCA